MYICNHPCLPSYIASGEGTCSVPNGSSQCLQEDNIISSNQISIDASKIHVRACVSACMHACVRACVHKLCVRIPDVGDASHFIDI